MGAKPSRQSGQLYRRRTNTNMILSQTEVSEDDAGQEALKKGRRASVLWLRQLESRRHTENTNQAKTLKINVQKASHRRNYLSHVETSEQPYHKASLSTFDSSRSLLPIGVPKSPQQQQPFISSPHLLLKRQTSALITPSQPVQFEDTSSTAVLYKNIHKKVTKTSLMTQSHYRLIKPKSQEIPAFPSQVETEPAHNMMEILREATAVEAVTFQPVRKNVMDLKDALSPNLKPSRSKINLGQFELLSFSTESERHLAQYRIKTEKRQMGEKEDSESIKPANLVQPRTPMVRNQSNRKWTWRARGGVIPQSPA